MLNSFVLLTEIWHAHFEDCINLCVASWVEKGEAKCKWMHENASQANSDIFLVLRIVMIMIVIMLFASMACKKDGNGK